MSYKKYVDFKNNLNCSIKTENYLNNIENYLNNQNCLLEDVFIKEYFVECAEQSGYPYCFGLKSTLYSNNKENTMLCLLKLKEWMNKKNINNEVNKIIELNKTNNKEQIKKLYEEICVKKIAPIKNIIDENVKKEKVFNLEIEPQIVKNKSYFENVVLKVNEKEYVVDLSLKKINENIKNLFTNPNEKTKKLFLKTEFNEKDFFIKKKKELSIGVKQYLEEGTILFENLNDIKEKKCNIWEIRTNSSCLLKYENYYIVNKENAPIKNIKNIK